MPVVHVQETDDRPGGAANVAVNLAALGVTTSLVGVVGKDSAAAALESIMGQRGIECGFARAEDRPTITKTRVQSRGQQLIRLDEENVAIFTAPETVERERLLASCDACPVDAITVWNEEDEQLVP